MFELDFDATTSGPVSKPLPGYQRSAWSAVDGSRSLHCGDPSGRAPLVPELARF
jgi:hypothetical protein